MIMVKEEYSRPTAELINIYHQLSLLTDFSADGGLGDWEDGGEF